MSDTFTSEIFAWLRQVFADKTLHPTAFKLAFAVSQYINRKTQRCGYHHARRHQSDRTA